MVDKNYPAGGGGAAKLAAAWTVLVFIAVIGLGGASVGAYMDDGWSSVAMLWGVLLGIVGLASAAVWALITITDN
ncbi:hypothetical protein [Streptomyces microflavus]|uniref:hypothetical protein n=1 Tax=Streptomyces microflavus TaxID=1919 RepID=UPI00369E70DE